MLIPDFLKAGDKVAIISPATKIRHEYVAGTCRWLEQHGLRPVPGQYADGEVSGCISGSFAATRPNRLSDLKAALSDPEVKAILCARGGYGCIQLLPDLPLELIRNNPKWLIGFSDISALHAAFSAAGVMSMHASMAKHLTLNPEDGCSNAFFNALTGHGLPNLTFDLHPYNKAGSATGKVIGGNLAVLNGLASTPVDIFRKGNYEGAILFIEDIGENIYEVDRMLTRLSLSGVLDGLGAILVGQFTEYHEDLNYDSMQTMISRRLKELGVDTPLAFNLPVGHTDNNMPVIVGATASVNISDRSTTLSYE